MTLLIPELKLPLGGISACAGGLSLLENPEVANFVPLEQSEDIAPLENGKGYLRLLRERFEDGTCHFHIDLYSSEFIKVVGPTVALGDITKVFDALLGKTLPVDFHSRFRLKQSDIHRTGLIPVMGGLGINLGGTIATLSGASIRIADTIYREIKWKQSVTAPNESPQFEVELRGTLGPVSVSGDLLKIVMDRAVEGFQRFVLPPRRQHIVQRPGVPKA